jgi:hypothetical protein
MYETGKLSHATSAMWKNRIQYMVGRGLAGRESGWLHSVEMMHCLLG